MKKIAFFAVTLFVCATATAQELKPAQVPAAVKAAFQKKYPESQAKEWEKEGPNYEAEFEKTK